MLFYFEGVVSDYEHLCSTLQCFGCVFWCPEPYFPEDKQDWGIGFDVK